VRVTDSTMYAQMRAGLATRREHLERAQSAAISGRRVQKPSDDPAAMAKARSHSAQESRSIANERTVNVTLTALQVADSALDQIGESLARARELALQASSGTISAEDRSYLANEVEALRSQVLGLANTQEGGRYVFAGMKDGDSPFGADGVYNGDTEAQQVEISKGLRIPLGVTGDRILGAAGGQDVFAALSDLTSALRGNDVDAVRASLDQLDQGSRQVRSARVDIGGGIDATEVARSVAERGRDQAVAARSALLDADPLDAFTELSRAQGALEAAVAVAAQLPPPGLASTARL
jgi:flagellar hook-associated protein 3 FlgL